MWAPLCPQPHTLSWSELNLRQHSWVRTTSASSKYLSTTVNDAVKSVYWHQACSCQTAPVFISIPSFLPLDRSSQQHLLVLLQKADARLPNTGPDTEQQMFQSHKIWTLGTGRPTLGYPSIFTSLCYQITKVFLLYIWPLIINKSLTPEHWLGITKLIL